MSVSEKNNFKLAKSIKDENVFVSRTEKREASLENPRNNLSLKNIFYKIDDKSKFNKDLTILNFINNSSEGRCSAKTSLTYSAPEKFEYDLCMINKYDENLNTSLSFISEFDLEDEKENDSFNSSDNASCIEVIEIKKNVNNKRILDDAENKEINFEFEKDWEDIKDLLLNKERHL